jgi:putative salt-induced outer membrane protein YdiY
MRARVRGVAGHYIDLPSIKRVTALWILLLLATASVALAQNDTVTTATGETMTGEIMSVQKDVLTMSTPYSDADFKIKWDQVVSIDSARQFLIETFDGRRLSGSLTTAAGSRVVQVGADTIGLADVSVLQPFERSFWSRFSTTLDFGYSMTQANEAKQLTIGGNLLYRDAHVIDTVLGNVFRSSQSNAPETQRWNLGNDFRYLLGDRWYANTTQDFLNSDEQSLDLRTTIGVGGGRYLLRSASQYLAVGAGLAWTREDYTDAGIETKNSTEAYLGSEFMTEKLKVADLVTRLNYYPSLTIDDRYRLNYTFDLDFNLPGDWYIRVSLFENYDSLPPAGLSKNDWGWSNAFGFKF